MWQSCTSPQRQDPPQEYTNPMQIPQMGCGQSGEKAQKTSSEASDGTDNQGTTGA